MVCVLCVFRALVNAGLLFITAWSRVVVGSFRHKKDERERERKERENVMRERKRERKTLQYVANVLLMCC